MTGARLTSIAVLAVVVGLAGCGEEEPAEQVESGFDVDTGDVYTTDLEPLNDSGVEGISTINVGEGVLETEPGAEPSLVITVGVEAGGLTPNRRHAQHIHVPPEGEGECPTSELDRDDDDVVSIEEGEEAYGPVRIPLDPFPRVGGDGSYIYEENIEIDPRVGLLRGVVVVHGMNVGGRYEPSVPVACGALSR